ncbi:MAG: SDR family oxidoreductase [Hyphomicrobiaceae bacterium]|nr:MAG: SDR family oxidoreductase [Hyphomicrobiaceae bacterium]
MERPVAIVTGAANNIGRAIAQELSASHSVVLLDIADTTGLAAQLPHAVSVTGDVTSEEACASAVAVAGQLGALKAVVHCAGITQPTVPVSGLSRADWDKVLRVNLTGSFVLAKAAIAALVAAAPSALVLISSRAGKTGYAGFGQALSASKAHYAASKAGVNSLVKSLAIELAEHGVRVNGIAPGAIATDMIDRSRWEAIAAAVPLKRIGTPVDIAQAARFLIDPRASGYITGQILNVNGGTLME